MFKLVNIKEKEYVEHGNNRGDEQCTRRARQYALYLESYCIDLFLCYVIIYIHLPDDPRYLYTLIT